MNPSKLALAEAKNQPRYKLFTEQIFKLPGFLFATDRKFMDGT